MRVEAPDYAVQEGEECRDGTVEDVVYLGPITRQVVRLADGSTMNALTQNLDLTSDEVRAARGRAVRLVWQRRHAVEITRETERENA